MKRFSQILLGFAALGVALSVQAMPLGLRMALWNRSAREVPSYTVGETLAVDATSSSLPWAVGADGVASARGQVDATASGGKSVKFTAADNASAWVETVVTNACRVSFDWKCSCEPLVKGKPYDYLAFVVDSERTGFICGETDWTNVAFYVTGDGEHRLRWMFTRDEEGSSGEDSAWLANVKVVPSVTLVFADGGATEGSVPEAMAFYADDGSALLPGCGTLAWPKHTFLGWSDGVNTYAAGTVATNAVFANGMAAVAGRPPYLLTAVWTANTLAAPVITAPATYEAESATVTITAEDGAAIYYTLDGSEPRAARSVIAPYQWVPDTSSTIQYQGAFEVVGSATIRAIAVRDGYFDSEVATATVTRLTWTFGEYLNWPEQTFTTGGEVGWSRVKGVSADGYALRSGAITHNQTSRLETVVSGPGTVSFKWKVSCEDYFVFRTQKILLDYLSFSVDGTERGLINGETGWTNVTLMVEGEGEHVLAWSYIKDSEGSEGEDCAWLDEVVWTPTGTLTGLEAWLAERNLTVEARAANGRTAAECYALGLDPADATNDFRIVSIEMVDGEPKVEWEPKVNRWTGTEIQAVLKGAATLDGEWKSVEGATAAEKVAMRFFKVEVVP